WSVWTAAALAGGLPRGDARSEGFRPETLDRIKAAIEDAVAKKQVAGGTALVARQGKVVYLATVGQQDAEEGRPLAEDTIFRIASMTKPITSAAVLMLFDDGKLSPSDPVSKYLPEFKDTKVLVLREPGSNEGPVFDTTPAKREITIHDLLTHTSGIS